MPLLSVHNLDFLLMVSFKTPNLSLISCCSFPGAISVTSGVFGDDIASTVLNSVTCYGNETELLNCSHSTSGTCSEQHNAAVICQSMYMSL